MPIQIRAAVSEFFSFPYANAQPTPSTPGIDLWRRSLTPN